MNKLPILLLLMILSLFSTACRNSNDDKMELVADSFSENFFNWRYDKCIPYVTDESRNYLSFMATNVTDDDIDILRSMQDGVSIECKDINYSDNDSTVEVKMRVSNICYSDTIGRKARIYDYADATLLLVKTNKEWKVIVSNEYPRMAFPLQNEQQGHDLDKDEE